MMNNSGGALLTEVYGSDTIKVKKKDKKKKEQKEQKEQQQQVYMPPNKEHIYPDKLEKITSFDENFHEKTNIMPYGGYSNEEYFPINKEDNIKGGGGYFPYDKYTFEGHRKPVPPTVKTPGIPQPSQKQEEVPKRETLPPTEPSNVPETVYEEPPKQWVWDKGMKISHQEYKEFQDFKQFKANQQIEIIQQQREKSQEGIEESFSNINDDFNDVLLFGLLGIFFLIFTDYVYKLGRKSY